MGTSEEGRDKDTRNLALEPKMDKIKLSDGREYELSPMNINILAELEDKFEKPLDELFTKGRLSFVRYILFLRLRKNYPELDTEEKVGELVTLQMVSGLLGTIYGV